MKRPTLPSMVVFRLVLAVCFTFLLARGAEGQSDLSEGMSQAYHVSGNAMILPDYKESGGVKFPVVFSWLYLLLMLHNIDDGHFKVGRI